ncbi:hypothetical protein SEA_TORTELLINI_69 [Mycobacterium phage Tortellini]|uniref:Uncharacterized protein n=1 Tax=Mycobacterium phage Tortellini TaxID=1897497 RepID=A0A1D8EX75_9CAUD|nr:hypothetical protein FDH05_gp69 [Mycobacterium phage Tortellini]AOT25814.1 hypothetical protein SEA_TORTELLINI_69 [Mycobacterium phage Tortellini]
MTDPKIWLPFSRAELIRRGRCTGCGCHPKQGHKPECPSAQHHDQEDRNGPSDR